MDNTGVYEMNFNEVVDLAKNGSLVCGTDNDSIVNSAFLAVAKLIARNNTKVNQVERATAENSQDIKDMKNEYTILPAECHEIQSAVKKKMVEVIGGKKSEAYKDGKLRTKICRDIWDSLKREYGLVDETGRKKSYMSLPRKYYNGAFEVIKKYTLPIVLANEVDEHNEPDFDFDD